MKIQLKENEGMTILNPQGGVLFSTPTIPNAVDLGLPSGTLWADRNVGASSPEDTGLYFAYGSTDGKKLGSICETPFYNDMSAARVLSQGSSQLLISEQFDAARKCLGAPWRMPTFDDFLELIDGGFVTLSAEDVNNMPGVRVTSNTNGNSIFIPFAGQITLEHGHQNYLDGAFCGTVNNNGTPNDLRSFSAFIRPDRLRMSEDIINSCNTIRPCCTPTIAVQGDIQVFMDKECTIYANNRAATSVYVRVNVPWGVGERWSTNDIYLNGPRDAEDNSAYKIEFFNGNFTSLDYPVPFSAGQVVECLSSVPRYIDLRDVPCYTKPTE